MRIISGNFKGKKILLPKDKLTRPLKDLTKESIFNILKHSKLLNVELENSNILDLFSGVGSFGLECLSRGAKNVTFLESYKEVLNILKKNIDNLNQQNQTKVIEKDIFSENTLKLLNDKFDLYVNNSKTLDFVEAKLKESELRHLSFGSSRYVVEPNVKNGKGGLRDLHTLIWISKFVYKVDTVSRLINIGGLLKREAFLFADAQRFLISVRCHLHYRASREDDRLAMDAQLDISKSMNFKNRITQKDVERFMKRYFIATKIVGNLTRIFCADIETKFKKPLRINFLSFKKTQKFPPFNIEVGRLTVKNKQIFTENPNNIIKIFNCDFFIT